MKYYIVTYAGRRLKFYTARDLNEWIARGFEFFPGGFYFSIETKTLT